MQRRHQSIPAATGTNLSVPVDHHLLCKAHFNWITPQTSSLLRRHDGWLGVLRDGQRHSINRRVQTRGGKINSERGYSRPARRTQRLTIAVQKASVREVVTVRWKTKLTVACLWEKKQRECMRYANGERLYDRRVFELLGRGVINASLYSPSCVAGWSHWYSPPGPWVETQAHKRTRGIIIFLHPPSTNTLSLSLPWPLLWHSLSPPHTPSRINQPRAHSQLTAVTLRLVTGWTGRTGRADVWWVTKGSADDVVVCVCVF